MTTDRSFNAVRTAVVAAAALVLAAPPVVQAQPAKWPEKPIRIVVAGPAGGSADIVARLLADMLSKELGQPVYAEPKPGAAGVLAVNDLGQEIGFEVGQPRTPQELAQSLSADYERMGTVLKSIDFKPE